ncbi:MAG TPA: hypothetical protein VHR88_01940 [Solirubrobacteraceae bacterium]|nr:hypothetical protein [Solirubrobacteraceae bacterium]
MSTARPEDAVRRAKQELTWTGQPDAAWSVVLEAGMSDPLEADLVDERLAACASAVPELGPPARARAIRAVKLPAVRSAFADTPYADRGPALRVALTTERPAVVLIAGHHGALDGLGLVALLGSILAAPITSSVRGLGPAPAAPWRPRAILARLAEVVLAPPARVVPARHHYRSTGDQLLAATTPALAGGTATLVGAALRAVRGWNRARGGDTRRPVVAIGASRRDGTSPRLGHEAAWLRLALAADDDAAVRLALERAMPAPTGGGLPIPRVLRPLARRAAEQLGSTLLVSNLGSLQGPAELQSVAFFPKAYGRSGVALGAATVGDASTITMRARARSFGREDLERLLAQVVRELPLEAAAGAEPAPLPSAEPA